MDVEGNGTEYIGIIDFDYSFLQFKRHKHNSESKTFILHCNHRLVILPSGSDHFHSFQIWGKCL